MSERVTRFNVDSYESPRAGRLAIVTMDNGGGPRQPPTFGRAALDSLAEALAEVERGDYQGLLLTGKPFGFAAGADVDEFEGAGAAFARDAGRRGHELFGRLRDLPMPTLAAINGVCMGSGLEIALHCDARTLSKGAMALAFPEVFLSIVPAWGGTQLAPRVAGGPNALRVIVHNALDQNRTLKPRQAFELGLADRLLDPVDFLEDSLRWLEAIAAGDGTLRRDEPPNDGLGEALEQARAYADAKVHGATRAPYLAIELIEHAARGGDLAAGLAREEKALEELLPSRQAQAAVYAFQLTQSRARKQPGRPKAEPRPVRRVAVVGAGTMGAQLGAQLLQRLEVPIVLKDIDESVLARARRSIEDEVDGAAAKGRLSEGKADFLKSIVTYTTEDEALAGSDFLIEAVLEKLDLKKKIFADAERFVDGGCVLATNTSSLSVSAMAEDLERPSRVVGFHLFNPVKVLPLVEVACPEDVADEVVSTAFEVARRLRKSPVRCADSTAFVVNRLLLRFMAPCMQAASRGNGFREVDRAIQELGLPMGPFALLGLVGPEIAWHTLGSLHESFPERFPLDPNLQALAESGRPGVYRPDGEVDEEVRKAWRVEPDASPWSEEEIRQRALEAVADEAHRMLADLVVPDARDIDTCLLLGAGWPFFTGGICKHLDQIGLSQKLFGEPLIGPEDRALAAV